MIELGRKVKDVVTGLVGVAEARLQFLNGCEQILVRPKVSTPKKGEVPEYPSGTYIDIEQLVYVGKVKVKLTPRKNGSGDDEPSGGIRQHPD